MTGGPAIGTPTTPEIPCPATNNDAVPRAMTTLSPLSHRWDWQRQAKCRFISAELFFPPDGEGKGARVRREQLAKQICQSCPVQRQCWQHALTVGESFGVWGGTSESDRRAISIDPTKIKGTRTARALRISPTHPVPGRGRGRATDTDTITSDETGT